MNGAPRGQTQPWLGPTMVPLLSMTLSGHWLPWTSTVKPRVILQSPSPVHSPPTHHASIRINRSNRSSSPHCGLRHKMTTTAMPHASCNSSQIWESVVASSPEVLQDLLARPPMYHPLVMDFRSLPLNSNVEVPVTTMTARLQLLAPGTRRNAFSTTARRTRT